MLPSTWYPRPRHGTLDPRQKDRLPCEQAWLRSVTKVWMTDTSACGRIEFHILWFGIASVSYDHVFETRFSRLVSVYEEVMAKNKDTNHYECNQPEKQSFEPELVSRPRPDRPRTSKAPCLAKGNLQRINRFRLDLFRCCKSKSCCNLDSWVC